MKRAMFSARSSPHLSTFCPSPIKGGGGRIKPYITLGGLDLLRSGMYERAVIAIGDNRERQRIAHYYKGLCTWMTLIHPYSFVHSTCSIGDGSVAFGGVVIQPGIIIGEHRIVKTSASVDHDCFLRDFVHIGPGVRFAGGVTVEEDAFVGAGAVAIKDVAPYPKSGWCAGQENRFD